ncbi:hypothetical protein [Phocaeicola sartorii]|jgi:hypothetical protein|uniref:Uncharacterized protein n=1 Tax=Phocaeicola sartorii TaxID=671267 RepID=R9I9U3_9BACT|nr:hypothetical protein [Phocaeicola sartorii]EOS13714.1 hypothetical protein C802_01557 [Phocaeicola sartorii]MCR1843988.1 hypothetical protein [Phocaeicola sartorii]NUL00362.1 hypothetical protein [Phocaeicola sartorii]
MKYTKITYCKAIILGGIIGVTAFFCGILTGYGFYKENRLINDPFSLQIFPYSSASINPAKIEIIKRKEKNGTVELEAMVKNKKLLEELSPLQIIILKGTGHKKEIISRSRHLLHFGKNKIKIKTYPSCHIEVGYFRKEDLYQAKPLIFYSKTFY